MEYKGIKIIEAGETANSVTGEDGELYRLSIAPESLESLAALGNRRKIHCRKTHNGVDMLDGYIGYFENFVIRGAAVYADLTISEAAKDVYPSETAFIEKMIETEPELIGVSVFDVDTKEFNSETKTAKVVEFTDLLSCDIVGLPAATGSLFNKLNENKMSKFFSNFASLFGKTALAVEKVETKDGKELLIESATGELAVGDFVKDSDGNPIPDGEEVIKADDGFLVLVIKDGKIADVKAFEEEGGDDGMTDFGTKTPSEFGKRLSAMEASIASIAESVTKLSKGTITPVIGSEGVPSGSKGKTKLSKEAVELAAAKYYKK